MSIPRLRPSNEVRHSSATRPIPGSLSRQRQTPTPVTAAPTESIWRSRLQIGVEISLTREGLVLIDFGGWHETSKAEALNDPRACSASGDLSARVSCADRRLSHCEVEQACRKANLALSQGTRTGAGARLC
jgi:hypothetical protein